MTAALPIPAPDEPIEKHADDVLDGWDLPAEWTASARDAFAAVVEVRPDLNGPELAALVQACALVTTADLLDVAAREAGLMVAGSQGQPVLNPAVTEARQARSAAAGIFGRLVPAKVTGSTSERARAAARARWSSS